MAILNITPMQKLGLLIITIITLLCSCRKLVTEDFPDIEPVPVLNAIISANNPIEAHISYAENINGDTISLVDDVIVILKEGDVIIDTLAYAQDGIYQSKIRAQEERAYDCEAVFADGTILTTSTYLPKQMNIIAYEHIKEAGRDEEGTIYPSVRVTFENDPSVACYYQLLINLEVNDYWEYEDENGDWQYETYNTYRPAELLNITDPLIVNEGLPLSIFSNELIEGDSYTMELNYTTGTTSGNGGGSSTEYYPLVIELRSISYEYYRYTKQLYLYELGRYPDVIGDVARVYPLYSNINNGYGIFASYTTCITDTITVE